GAPAVICSPQRPWPARWRRAAGAWCWRPTGAASSTPTPSRPKNVWRWTRRPGSYRSSSCRLEPPSLTALGRSRLPQTTLGLEWATGRGPIVLLKAGVAILKGVGQAKAAFDRLGADVVVGFGGYPSAPALVAAVATRRPTVIHEQNAVLGRTNRMLASTVGTVAAAFPTLWRAPARVGARARLVGNPVRPDIRALFDRAYVAPVEDGPIHVLVTGGSQGARILSETAPRALAALPEAIRN